MYRQLYTAFIAAGLLGGISGASAQDSSRVNQLNTVTVTAAKGPQKAGETGKVITILSREFLQQNSGRTISSLLNQQTGLVITGAESNRGHNQDVYMRGAATGNTLILIDGIPVSDASLSSNAFDINFLNPSQVERIEILRGSQSTLYGSDAVAGVINIITRRASDKKISGQLQGAYGSYNTWQGNAALSGTVNKFSYLLGYKYENTDGFSEAWDSTGKGNFDKDGFRQHAVFAKLGLQATKRWNLQYLFNWSDYNHDLDAGGFTDDKDYSGKNKYLLNALSSEYRFNKGSWHVIYSYQRNNRDMLDDSTDVPPYAYHPYDISGFTANTHQVETYVNWNVLDQLRLIAGADFRTSNTSQRNYFTFALPAGKLDTALLGSDSSHTRQFSTYAALQLHDIGGFNMELGGRFNYHNIYGNNQTISFNPSYLINNRHKVFVNIASAYKVPSLYQLYARPYGNKNLKPEMTVNYEAGYQAAVAGNRLNFRATGFYRDTRDLIVFYYDAASGAYSYVNADKQRAYGAELEASWEIIRGLDLSVNYTYVDGRVETKNKGKDTSYYNLYLRPKHAVNATLGYQVTPSLYVSTQLKYVGQRYQGIKPVGDYYTLDLYGEYKFGNLLKIFAGFRNITDYKYFEIPGYNTRGFNFTTGLVCSF